VKAALAALSAPALLLWGCAEGPQRVTDPAGPAAHSLLDLMATFVWVTTVPAAVFIIVLVVLAVRRRRVDAPSAPRPRLEEGVILALGGGLSLVIVTVLMLVSFGGARAVMEPPFEPELTVEVTGHMFWWEVRYPDHGILTANEVHIPVARPVRVRLHSVDVIHSFWVPQLHGKLDMIPGRIHELWLQADRAGELRGQCAEFCGVQHALMAFLVIVEEQGDFESWLDAQARLQAPRAEDTLEARGEAVYVRERCQVCHAVRGSFEVEELEAPGPDLTHLATRRTLGAATVRRNRDTLREWVANPHRRKPGVRMPATRLSDADMEALMAYLESLR
jgi:cytochrome c oxidase subunit II